MWSEMSLCVHVCLDTFVHVIVRLWREDDSKCYFVVWGQPSQTHSSCRRCCHPPPHCLCKWCLQSPSDTWRFHPPSVTLLLCLLLRLHKLPHCPSAPAVPPLFSHSLLKRFYFKRLTDSNRYTWSARHSSLSFECFTQQLMPRMPPLRGLQKWETYSYEANGIHFIVFIHSICQHNYYYRQVHSHIKSDSHVFKLCNETQVNKLHIETITFKHWCTVHHCPAALKQLYMLHVRFIPDVQYQLYWKNIKVIGCLNISVCIFKS